MQTSGMFGEPEGEPVSREERRKLREWGNDEMQGCTARLVSLAFERMNSNFGPLGTECNRRAGATGPTEGQPDGRDHRSRTRGSPTSRLPMARQTASMAQRGNAAVVRAALGKPQPAPIDADLLQGECEIHLEEGPSCPSRLLNPRAWSGLRLSVL